MDQQINKSLAAKEVVFPNGHRAQVVTPEPGTEPTDIIKTLDIDSPKAIFYLTGGAGLFDKKLAPLLEQLFSRGVVRAAIEMGAFIMDGGTQSGVMEIMGQSVADRGHQIPLLGVAPAGLVTYPEGPEDSKHDTPLDPNHSHFVLVDSQEWGGETDTMIGIAAVFAQSIPVITVLVNGGAIAKQEILRSVRKGWPIVILQNSGRLADEIATLWQEKLDFIPDPAIAEIIAEGDIHLFPLDGSVAGIQRLLKRLISNEPKGNNALEFAWQYFADYDANAERQQNNFNRMQLLILALGVVATTLVVLQATQRPLGLWLDIFWVRTGLHYIIVALPITISVLLAAANYFNAGNKWISLRGSAEAIKREIFRYRATAEIYAKSQTTRTSAEIKLTRKIEAIRRNLMQTDVNLMALHPYQGPIPPANMLTEGDDGFSFLTTDEYLVYRLEDQLNFYRKRTMKFARHLSYLKWLIYIVGGVGTLLAAIGLDLWIAVTTALATAFASYLNYQRTERILITYNQSATDLANVQGWWLALSPEEQADQKNIDMLVNQTEQICKNEHAGWVQEMQDALAELRADQTDDDDQTTSPSDEES